MSRLGGRCSGVTVAMDDESMINGEEGDEVFSCKKGALRLFIQGMAEL